MHPLSLLIFWLVLGRDFQMANVDASVGQERTLTPLLDRGRRLSRSA